MRIVLDHAGVAVGVPRVVRPVPERFVQHCMHYMDDSPARKHPHPLRVRCIRTGLLCSIVLNLERLHCSKFVPDILVASQLRRNWRAVHLSELPLDSFYRTRSRGTVDAVFHRLHLTNFADWIVIPVQILAGSCMLLESDNAFNCFIW